MQEVRRLREKRGWNQTELAFHATLAPSVISQIENGKRNPSASTLKKLANALGVEVGDLFPKAETPLPFNEGDERQRSPFLGAWTSYMLRRAQEWEDALPERANLFADSRLALEFLTRSEMVEAEAFSLIETIRGALDDAVYGDTPESERRIEDWAKRLEEWDDLLEYVRASIRANDVALEWLARASDARKAVTDADMIRGDRAPAGEVSKNEKIGSAAEDLQNVVALFEARRSA